MQTLARQIPEALRHAQGMELLVRRNAIFAALSPGVLPALDDNTANRVSTLTSQNKLLGSRNSSGRSKDSVGEKICATYFFISTKLSSGFAGPSIEGYCLDLLLTVLSMDREKWHFEIHYSICKGYCLY